MNLSIGIVGLPNVGKSTLFNALLKKQVALAANYPFATIEPNVGVVEVPDERLTKLAEVVHAQKIVPAVVEFYDIAGLVKGAATGEGLGNKFLSHIREVAAIAHVVRLFEDGEVLRVSYDPGSKPSPDSPDPGSDIQIIEQELILADLSTLEKQREPKMNATKEELATNKVVQKLKIELNNGTPARGVNLSDEEKKAVQQLNLLTMKPVIYVFNVSESQLGSSPVISRSEATRDPQEISRSARNDNTLYLCAKLESEIVALSPEDQKEYLKQYGLHESGLNRLAQKAYETLGLISFLTAGEKEARAWTITNGMIAPQAAGVIHTDFEKNFIKAEVVPYQIFVDFGGWQKCRDAGKVTLAGKDYVMKDGDVVDFKIGV